MRSLACVAAAALLLLGLLVCCVGTANALTPPVHTAHNRGRGALHCYRPLDALQSFGSEMSANDNCNLDFVTVTNASVSVRCRAPQDGDESGCYATMHFRGTKAGGYHRKGYAKGDEAKFRVKLHAQGVGSVHYKGMDGEGYSVCCALLDQPAFARCEWVNRTTTDGEATDKVEQVPRDCALTESATDAQKSLSDPLGLLGKRQAVEFSGSVTKPLHRSAAALWTMELSFLRGSEQAGKVVVDFNITEDMLLGLGEAANNRHHHHDNSNQNPDGGAHHHHHAAAAHVADGAGAVVPVEKAEDNGSDADPHHARHQRHRSGRRAHRADVPRRHHDHDVAEFAKRPHGDKDASANAE